MELIGEQKVEQIEPDQSLDQGALIKLSFGKYLQFSTFKKFSGFKRLYPLESRKVLLDFFGDEIKIDKRGFVMRKAFKGFV